MQETHDKSKNELYHSATEDLVMKMETFSDRPQEDIDRHME
jgi:hypothetical protein